MTRPDGRAADELRPVAILPGFLTAPAGSVLIEMGATRVLCAASLETSVPRWRRGSGLGWVTAEYSMLPASTAERSPREAASGRIKGRTQEIQRLIGRSLRAAINLGDLGENSIVVDCDVLEADGGTRTAAVTGGWVALSLALDTMVTRGLLPTRPPLEPLSAVSVGVVDGEHRLDLCYAEDVRADTDMNVVVAGDGRMIEVQGTAEQAPFSRSDLDTMLDLAGVGCAELAVAQRQAAGQ